MTDTTNTEVKQEEKKPAVEIIRGRMPVAIVALARFGNNKDKATKELANLFGTTVGKIDDIKKNRNFAYVTADFKPTQAMKDEGVAWLKKHPDYDKAGVDTLVVELESIPVASDDEAKAFEGVRAKARGQTTTTKTGEAVTDAGGGNRRKPRNSKAEVAQATGAQATGEALLA